MPQDVVVTFRPYPFRAGQKIHVENGQRKGDWEVIRITDRRAGLRCPISGREVEWDRFCYFVSEERDVEWPRFKKGE